MNRWQQIEKLYQAALQRGPKERSAFLDQACGGDKEMRREVESLLTLEQPTATFRETPALEATIKKIAREKPPSLITFATSSIAGLPQKITHLSIHGQEGLHLAAQLSVLHTGFLEERSSLPFLNSPAFHNALQLARTAHRSLS